MGDHEHCCHGNKGVNNGAIYCLGVLGAAIYFIKMSTGFWMGALGILKAFFWPALIVYRVLDMWKM